MNFDFRFPEIGAPHSNGRDIIASYLPNLSLLKFMNWNDRGILVPSRPKKNPKKSKSSPQEFLICQEV